MAKFRPLRRTADADEQRLELVRHAEQIDRVPIMNGQLVRIEWPFDPAGPTWATSVRAAHSLERAYRGAFICGTSGETDLTYPVFTVVHPSQAITAGADIAREFIVVTASTLTQATVVEVWIF